MMEMSVLDLLRKRDLKRLCHRFVVGKRLAPLSVLALCMLFLFPQPNAAAQKQIPNDFSYLSLLVPTIQQDIRYTTSFNFVGEPVDGYRAPECILTTRAAKALGRVQDKLLEAGFSLKVYDCYRPKAGVAHFVRWARSNESYLTKKLFYPNETKSQLFKRGYIAKKSGHSRGSTVDLTIVHRDSIPPEQALSFEKNGRSCAANPVQNFELGIIDMGTRYDCLDVASGTSYNGPQAVLDYRQFLTKVMASEGFKGYSKEWWHFTLRDEPYKKTYFDFPVVAPNMDDLLRNAN